MDKVIVSFARKGVIRRDQDVPYRSGRFLSRRRVFERVSASMARARYSRFHTKTSVAELEMCAECAAKVASSLPAPGEALRVLRVVEWYERWCDEHFEDGVSRRKLERERYMPVVHAGPSLERKFISLENQMRAAEDEDRVASTTVDDVVRRTFNGSRVIADSFRTDVLARTIELDVGDVPEPVLAAKLAEAYQAIRAARPNGATPEGVLGPMTLLERYVQWLGERDWRMTTRVLDVASPAFQQFRREQASLHPRGADPVTGRGPGE